jgi:protein MpaA
MMKIYPDFLFICLLSLTGCSEIKVLETKSNKTDTADQVTVSTKEAPEIKKNNLNITPIKQSAKIVDYCQELITPYFSKYNWNENICLSTKWLHHRNSVNGTPLLWTVFGNEKERTHLTNTTIVLCTVHGDEIVPTKFCFDLIEHLKQNPDLIKENDLVVIAPVVNPDSFFRDKPTRTNANGVDVNRNFPTRDWKKDAIRLWTNKYKKDPRRYPGPKAMSEPETIFQANLLMRYKPKKVVSVHAPLTLLDYDGPSKGSYQDGVSKAQAKELVIQMSDLASGYKVSNYPYFPGSLGNFAGNELRIPTYTLELPNTDWTKTKQFWNQFGPAVIHAIQTELISEASKLQKSASH